MSPIMELIKRASHDYSGSEYDSATESIASAAEEALSDLQRLVKWVKSAHHLGSCDIVTHWTENSIDDPPCSCGLSEIQSLLGE